MISKIIVNSRPLEEFDNAQVFAPLKEALPTNITLLKLLKSSVIVPPEVETVFSVDPPPETICFQTFALIAPS